MKNQYANYKDKYGVLEEVEKNLNESEKKILEDFIKLCSLTAKGDKLVKIKRQLLQFKDITETPINEQTKETIIHFISVVNNSKKSEHTKNEVKSYIKKFLKWNYKKDVDIMETLDLIKRKTIETNLTESDLLTEEEITLMLRNADSFKEKAYVYTLYESGLRPQELLNLQWKDVIFEEDVATIKVYSGKTGKYRETYVKNSKEYLWNWKQNYCFNDLQPTDYIFPSAKLSFMGNKRIFQPDRNKPMTSSGGIKILRRLAERSGIKKRIWNYLNRHTRATRLYEQLPTPIVEKLLGHKDQYRTYAHISNRSARNEIMEKVLGIKELPRSERETMQSEIKELKEKINAFEDIKRELPKIQKQLPEMVEFIKQLKKFNIVELIKFANNENINDLNLDESIKMLEQNSKI